MNETHFNGSTDYIFLSNDLVKEQEIETERRAKGKKDNGKSPSLCNKFSHRIVHSL